MAHIHKGKDRCCFLGEYAMYPFGTSRLYHNQASDVCRAEFKNYSLNWYIRKENSLAASCMDSN